MRFRRVVSVAAAALAVAVLAAGVYFVTVWFGLKPTQEDDAAIASYCSDAAASGLPRLAEDRATRFLGKVSEGQAGCRGGNDALGQRETPWVDWANYWGTGDATSRSERFSGSSHLFNRADRGVDGALLDLEYQRMELIKFNLFDNLTYQRYASDPSGPVQRIWPEMRLPADNPNLPALRVDADGNQVCQGELIRFRTQSGICNDIKNPAMGSVGQLFARNVAFEATFPELELNEYAKNRHGGRIGVLQPDPQVISRRLFTRDQKDAPDCHQGHGVPGARTADCSYKKAPFFNVLAAFWIQFMTHDWFSHLDEARNDQSSMMSSLGCATERVGDQIVPLSPERIAELGCRPEDRMEAAIRADTTPPELVEIAGTKRLPRAYGTTQNKVTAWWDGSQLYGWDERSRRRIRRDPADNAKLALVPVAGEDGERFLPDFRKGCVDGAADTDCDPIQPEWVGQEAAAFPDNWSVGLSFYHNLFAREHNSIIDEFRRTAKAVPNTDSGLRNPDRPNEVITYSQISDDELFEIARLIVAAEIAKVHTIEWTTQLLYDEPLYIGMNSNWSGLFQDHPITAEVTDQIVNALRRSTSSKEANQLYSAFAAGTGIVGRGNSRRVPEILPKWLSWDRWSIGNPDDVNGGPNHFGAPFNFPEDFPSVYRLHPMLPDMIEYRDLKSDPNAISERIPVIETFRGKATPQMHDRGLANWALSMGRQRLGLLALNNHPQFLQNLDLRPRSDTKIDVPALDLIRDREHGTPRYNEFRRQIGLRQVTSFDDFIDARLPADSPELEEQRQLAATLREVYGQHRCDASKIITDAQLDIDGNPINDCLGHADGSAVDNVEDVDLVVGIFAETTRPHGFAISETQFQIFILNASRRLFSDRFFTSSFRPEFYTKLGLAWVMNNGPTGTQWEEGEPNGHKQEVSPLKRILLRTMPELEPELKHVVNAFDPWARDRGEYYSLAWTPRQDAASDPAFAKE
jgi:hypothetical protein